MRVAAISDTHGMHRGVNVPKCDLLLFAGDVSFLGSEAVLGDFNDWLGRQRAGRVVAVLGNHDRKLMAAAGRMLTNATYLQDSGTEVDGVRIWGTPHTTLDGTDRSYTASLIPEDTDLLLSHSPPFRILDLTVDGHNGGCPYLSLAYKRIRPKFHVFGHIHEGYGRESAGGTTFVNCSQMDGSYRLNNRPKTFDI